MRRLRPCDAMNPNRTHQNLKSGSRSLAAISILTVLLGACSTPLDVKTDTSQKPTEAPGAASVNQLLNTLPAEYAKLGAPVPGGACSFDAQTPARKENLQISGWALIDSKTGATPEGIILRLQDKSGDKYFVVKPSSRPDVASYFKNDALSKTGFYAEIPRSQMSQTTAGTILQVFQGKIYECPTPLEVKA